MHTPVFSPPQVLFSHQHNLQIRSRVLQLALKSPQRPKCESCSLSLRYYWEEMGWGREDSYVQTHVMGGTYKRTCLSHPILYLFSFVFLVTKGTILLCHVSSPCTGSPRPKITAVINGLEPQHHQPLCSLLSSLLSPHFLLPLLLLL